MIPGLSGSLLSHEALADVVPRVLNGLLGEAERAAARRRLRAWHLPLRAHLGPALSLRAIYDLLAEPLFAGMGYHVVPSTHFHGVRARSLQEAFAQSSASQVCRGQHCS